jgi:hypothetical protein
VTPIALFDAVWGRCSNLSALHAYLASNVSKAVDPTELLRAEWAARVSALDLYIHELVAQRMLDIFDGLRPASAAFLRFQVSNETLDRIRLATNPSEARAAFDLDIRNQLSSQTFQDPEKIADGVRLCSTVELWNEVALKLGATEPTKVAQAKILKTDLSLVVRRRNKIVHEGDLQPSSPREPWPVTQADLVVVSTLIEKIVRAVDSVA